MLELTRDAVWIDLYVWSPADGEADVATCSPRARPAGAALMAADPRRITADHPLNPRPTGISPMRAFALITLLFAGPAVAAAQSYGPGQPPHAVQTTDGEWRDAARNRSVPYKLYQPRGVTGGAPVVLFSHGLGGAREGAAYINSHLAAHGYIVVALQHPGSDGELLRGRTGGPQALQAAMRGGATAKTAEDRFRDVSFALDELAKANASGPLAGRLDLTRVGMSGHSFGAVTTLAVAGQKLGPAGAVSVREPRLDAAIAYSPNKPRQGDAATVFDDIRIPVFHMTGTEDRGPLDPDQRPIDRTIPFRETGGSDQYLLVLTGGDHMIFSGRRLRPGQGGTTPEHMAQMALIKDASLAFWDAHLKGDPAALRWLTGEGLKTAARGRAMTEVKLAQARVR